MILITLLEKYGRLLFISSVEVRNMIADSSKPNKLRNVYTIRSTTTNVTIQKTENLLYQNQSHRANQMF